MWWALVGVAVAAIFDSTSKKEKEAAQRWELKRRELKQTISSQRKRINYHIRTAHFDLEFHRLNTICIMNQDRLQILPIKHTVMQRLV